MDDVAKLKAEVRGLSMKLSCLMDEMEVLRPGSSQRVFDNSIKFLEESLEKRLEPDWKDAVDLLRITDDIRNGRITDEEAIDWFASRA